MYSLLLYVVKCSSNKLIIETFRTHILLSELVIILGICPDQRFEARNSKYISRTCGHKCHCSSMFRRKYRISGESTISCRKAIWSLDHIILLDFFKRTIKQNQKFDGDKNLSTRYPWSFYHNNFCTYNLWH